jgi:hypothetical protein
MKKTLFSLLFVLCFAQVTLAGIVSGKIVDEHNEPLPFVTVYIKNTTTGTTSNATGQYTLPLSPGTYTLCFKLIGYKLFSENITVTNDLIVNAKLFPEQYELKEFEVKASDEDPAYRIIREAIKKRKYYLEQVDAFSCDVYIKGVQRILKKPEKIMGIEVDAEGDIDTTTGIVYLSESVSKFNFKQKDKIKEEMVSSKVSGDNKAFSYNQASDMLFNFYQNTIDVDGLSDRGFISPISNSAMFSYKYKLVGTFFEDGQRINSIQVIPKRKNDPVFSGIINIMEDSWRIHSLQLVLTKDAQIDFVDTLRINQLFVPIDKDIWFQFSNKFNFDFGILGIKGNGMYACVYSNYILNPDFPKHFFSGEIMKVNETANKKDSIYWQESRPVPLTLEEENDYRKRDSIARIKGTKSYKDSLDRKNNKFKIVNLIGGYTYNNTFKRRYTSFSGPLGNLQYNTVQGVNFNEEITFYKDYENNKSYKVGGKLGYGFSNHDFFGNVFASYKLNPMKSTKLSFKAGKDYSQFNGKNPIYPIMNSLYSLFDKDNYMKLYLKYFGRVEYTSELFNGFYISPGLEYANRISLINTSNYSFAKSNKDYTSNNPIPNSSPGYSFVNNKALTVDLKVEYTFKQRYYTMPNMKYITGSKYPKLVLNYKKGINAMGSVVNYDLITFGIEQALNLKRFGKSDYAITAGTFLNNKSMYFMDYYHFIGNKTLFSNFGLSNFQLLDYYTYSTKKQFIEGHWEHNFVGLFLNKVPLLKKLKLQEIGKISVLTTDGINSYSEISIGVKRLGFRADFVTSFSNQQKLSNGIRIGIEFF